MSVSVYYSMGGIDYHIVMKYLKEGLTYRQTSQFVHPHQNIPLTFVFWI